MESKKKTIGVYKISNIISEKFYIGYSTNIERRFVVHRSKLRSKTHDNIFLQRAYNLNGEGAFDFDIIHECETEEEAKEIELQYLSDLSIRDMLYNLNYNNSGGDLMSNHPDKEKIREKIAKSHAETISKMTPEEKKEKYGKFGEKNGMYGKTHTEEVKKLNSELKKGNTYFKGRTHTEEAKQKMSEIRKNKNTGKDNPFFGKHHSEETKQKIREKNTGKISQNAIKVSIDGKIYNSITEASRQLNKPMPTVLWRLNSKNPKFDSYKYINEEDVDNSTQPFQPLSVDDADNYEVQNLQPDSH